MYTEDIKKTVNRSVNSALRRLKSRLNYFKKPNSFRHIIVGTFTFVDDVADLAPLREYQPYQMLRFITYDEDKTYYTVGIGKWVSAKSDEVMHDLDKLVLNVKNAFPSAEFKLKISYKDTQVAKYA